MIDTKLILIEGIPGSGKSTIAASLSDLITKNNIPCQCHLEWSENNPIFIGHMDDLSEIISTSGARWPDVLRQWHEFALQAKRQNIVHALESRFWQADAMYLLLSGHPEEDIIKKNRQVVSAVDGLDPVLIYLAPENMTQHLATISDMRNKKWRASGKSGSWSEWGDRVYEQQQWFRARSIKGEEGFIRFFTEWTSLADRLFEILTFRKIKIPVKHENWNPVFRQIQKFLDLCQ